MKVYKEQQHSVTLHPFSWRGRRYLMVCVGLYVGLNPEGGTGTLRTEQEFWKEVPDIFAALGQAPLLDMCLPKPGGEILVAGFCRAPGESLVPAQEVTFRVGKTARRIAVFGDRERLPGGGVSEPIPFRAMPLIWERAFGGPAFALNPAGKGLDARNKPAPMLPNLEDPEHLLLSSHDLPTPACPFPVDSANPARRALSGTYDRAWQENRWPAYPDDCDPKFFQAAQAAQRVKEAGNNAFFQGDEDIEINGMRHDFPHIRSRLPQARLRAFVTTTETFRPFAPAASPASPKASPTEQQRNTGGPQAAGKGAEKKNSGPRLPYAKDLEEPGLFREATLHCDTVWLFPDLLGAFVLHRGLLPVEDDEMDDILRVLVVTEPPSEEPRSLEYYREELKKRAHPAVEIDLAPLIAAQATISKTVKMARDVPKFLEKIKKDFLGQSPIMPLSLGDMAHATGKTIATGRATLDLLEQQMLSQREQFSHLMHFDLSLFPTMRATLDAQEKNLHDLLASGERALRRAERESRKSVLTLRERLQETFRKIKKAASGALPEGASTLEAKLLNALDTFSPEGMLCLPEPLNPWHDRGFALVIAARRALRRNDSLCARLAKWGFAPETLENAWLGHTSEFPEERPERWGLPPGPPFSLPAGLSLPRFEGKALISLVIYPLDEHERLRGLGQDAAAIVRAPGSAAPPLSLPAAHPGGAVIAAPEELSALLAEQECGDFCHIAAAPDPAALTAVADLPPLQPKVSAEHGGLPLVVILPPSPGNAAFAPWREAFPTAIPLFLPEGCPHLAALAEKGHRLRRLVLDILPPELAAVHDFDIPLPPKDRPPEPFALNLPLPSQKELQGRIDALITDIRSHFPDPETVLAEETSKALEHARAALRRSGASQEALAELEALAQSPLAASLHGPLPDTPCVALLVETALARIAAMQAAPSAALAPEVCAALRADLDKAAAVVRALGDTLAPLDTLRQEGLAKLATLAHNELPPEVAAAFAAKDMDPDALRRLSRQEVATILAGDKNLARRNLQGLDLAGLDFSGANLAHALCGQTSFRGCRMQGADFTFTLAGQADFSGADLREARFKHTVLQKACLRQANCSAAHMELTTLGECDLTKADFAGAELKLCNITKASLQGARFTGALISLCAFSEVMASEADFRTIRAFKCLFAQAKLEGADFREATLHECLFQGAAATGLRLAGADMRKFYADADTDLSHADCSGADMREASLRLSRFCGAEFHQACLENALIAQCDFSWARLDGLRAAGCRFIKCDLTGADLSGTTLASGSLRKCRLNGADLGGTNLYAADVRGLILNAATNTAGMNCKRTMLEGYEEALRDAAQRNS